jgi:hypothetical protein
MIEHDGFPIVLSMTLSALLSIGPCMFVVLLVAGIAIRWGVFKGGSQMA